MSLVTRLASCGLALGLFTTGCVQKNDDVHPVAEALPTADDVRIDLPESAGDAFKAVGQIAPYYVATRNVTRTLNGATGWVLVLVHTIVQFPPTSVEGDTYTWGPWTEALDPAEYRLVVVDLADGSYDWQLDGKNKTEPGAAFETIIDGNAVPSDPVGTGHGTFTFDFDVNERVNPIDNDGRGVLVVAYDLDARTVDIQAVTAEERDGTTVPVAYDYAYQESADGAGDMVFATHGDSDDAGTLAEDTVLRSRWLPDGAGRGDARISGGDLGTIVVTASECWSSNFRRVYYSDSHEISPTEGDVAACAFADQDLPQ
jgi:hypothetical protein